jgi:uncharacterized cupredoxin-like copper-binding protein
MNEMKGIIIITITTRIVVAIAAVVTAKSRKMIVTETETGTEIETGIETVTDAADVAVKETDAAVEETSLDFGKKDGQDTIFWCLVYF